jgi:hypothetical protein
MLDFVILLITTIGCFSLAVWLGQRALGQIRQGFASRTWKVTTGQITQSEVTFRDLGSYYFKVRYRFEKDGREIDGTDINVGSKLLTFNRDGADLVAARYPLGKEVKVYYDAATDSSVLEPGQSGTSWAALGFALAFLGFSVITAYGTGEKARQFLKTDPPKVPKKSAQSFDLQPFSVRLTPGNGVSGNCTTI